MIEFDLDWVVNNWFEAGCDLWEEETSDDFYWNRMGYIYSLNKVADFLDLIGDTSGLAATYRSTSDDVMATIPVRGHILYTTSLEWNELGYVPSPSSTKREGTPR